MRTNRLFEGREDMMSMLGHQMRPFIYGVINPKLEAPKNFEYVQWGIMGLFNIDDDEVTELNCEYKYSSYLELVRDKSDREEGEDEYVKQYFRHDGHQWKIADHILSCDFCGGEEGIRSMVQSDAIVPTGATRSR